jgi:hypothetical protein
MVRREILGGNYIPIITPISKVVLFLAEIPSNLKTIIKGRGIIVEDRFPNISGFTGNTNDEEKFLLLSRYDGDIKESVVELIDLQSFNILHTWNPDLDSVIKKNGVVDAMVHPMLIEDGSLIFSHSVSSLIKIDKNSELEWIKDDDVYHHSNEEDIEDNFWVCVRYYPYKIDPMYVGNKYGNYSDDGIRKLSPDGEILFDKSVSEIFIENGMEYLLFSVGDPVFTRDPIHLNDIQPVENDAKYWKKGDVFLSLRHQSMILLYRPKTNEIIWKITWEFYHQHDVDILDDSRISIFNNNSKNTFSGYITDGNNSVVIYDFETDKYSHYLNESLKKENVRTRTQGRNQILPNGDLFFEETDYGRTLYFNSDGSLRWTHVNRGNDGNVYFVSWSRILYEDEDIQKVHSFLKIKNEVTHNE